MFATIENLAKNLTDSTRIIEIDKCIHAYVVRYRASIIRRQLARAVTNTMEDLIEMNGTESNRQIVASIQRGNATLLHPSDSFNNGRRTKEETAQLGARSRRITRRSC